MYTSPAAQRPSFPGDELVYPWLSMLLDAYHIADKGVAEAIRRELIESGQVHRFAGSCRSAAG
ncbi:MAG: hypothetical protein GWO16_10025 [Gammaproteobacteria bacterium]|nr:hypothetical protein [Gammaproteobacteria bacterium]NIR98862.1 hypothetical protein [Gammaproteobacteria bacterium]NIT63983.1 hypothetical protein [Gammaproteobacteria bacterium]NIV19143.1 hypothetical protein [Gammaproteobacteria bacterium]NIX10312.1 hypothetical protein [Gammaproteobacteria bacterium]